MTAKTAILGLGAFLCLLVGVTFLSIAAWILLLTVTTAFVACLILGSLFMGAGLVFVAILMIRSRARKRLKYEAALQAQAAQAAGLSGGLGGLLGLLFAFINGMNAGKKARF